MTNNEALNQICEIIEQYNSQVDSVIDYAEVKISYPQAIALYKVEHMLRILLKESKEMSEEIVTLLEFDYPRRDSYWDGYYKGYHDCEVEMQAKQAEGEKKDDGSNQE